MRAFVLSFCLLILFSGSAFAWQGEIYFDEYDRQRHAAGIGRVMDGATACLRNDLDRHQSFYDRFGVSRFYGDRSSFGKLSQAGRLEHIQGVLRRLGYSSRDIPSTSRHILSQMEPTSCVGLVLKCLGQGFRAAGQGDLWDRIAYYGRINAQDGTAIQHALRALGWRVLYWNPWVAYSTRWDEIERYKDPTNKNRFWGYHDYRWRTVNSRSRKYLYNTVDDITTLVNFARSVPASFRRVPFFVGTAHTGYHVFPGMYGNVIEGHSTRQITDRQTIESSAFNPLQEGGAPRGNYYSGLVAVPPGY